MVVRSYKKKYVSEFVSVNNTSRNVSSFGYIANENIALNT